MDESKMKRIERPPREMPRTSIIIPTGIVLNEAQSKVVDEIFDIVDDDKNGHIDMDEFFHLQQCQALWNNDYTDDESIRIAAQVQFRRIDKDQDGKISRDDLRSYFSSCFNNTLTAEAVLEELNKIKTSYAESTAPAPPPPQDPPPPPEPESPPPPPPKALQGASDDDDDVDPEVDNAPDEDEAPPADAKAE